ncbi:MAG: hypothetical protein ACI3Y7_07265 [Candidatus Cryptobacteroides sp.]
MKRTFKSLAVLALSALAMVSCQKELLGPAVQEGQEVAVSIDLTTPLMGTKAYGDGTTVDVVRVHVYQKDKNGVLHYITPSGTTKPSKDVPMNNDLTANYTTRLVTGQTYTFVFWAEKKNNGHYTYNPGTKNVTVSYANAAGNDESRDAFYAVLKDVEITGAYSARVPLHRPFAQINFGASDYDAAKAAGIEVTGAAVKLTNVANSLNLLTGDVTGNETVTFENAAISTIPNGTLTAANGTYKYVAMDYVLVGKDRKTLSDVTLTLDVTGTTSTTPKYTYTSVPLQGNFRTNIVGNLFTSPADIQIEVVPGFNNPDENVVVENVSNITAANTAFASGATSVNVTEITSSDPDAIILPATTSEVSLTLPAAPADKNITIKYADDATVYPAALNITAVNAESLTIVAPKTHVEVNGVTVTSLTASTSNNTLVVGSDVKVTTLTIEAGAVEIYGEVGTLTKGTNAGDVKVWAVGDKATFSKAYSAGAQTIELKNDIKDFESVIEIGRSLNLDGNGFAIHNKATRVVRITQPDLTVNFTDLALVSKCAAASDVRCVSFDDIASNANVLFDNCELSASFYCINVIPGPQNLNITLRNATVASGWAAINCYANNSTFTIENSTLKGLNDKGESSWNDFATIVFDGNGLNNAANIGKYGTGNTLNITNSVIYASSESSNNQAWLALQYGAQRNMVKVDAATKIIDDSDANQIRNITICNYVGTSTATFYDPESEIWIGEQNLFPGLYEKDGKYHIVNAAGLKYFSDKVGLYSNEMAGTTVLLDNDIDLAGVDFTPIGYTIASYPSNSFAGVFDGQGHTISNLKASSSEVKYAAAGLFGTLTGTVKNVKLHNVDITSTHYAGGVVGYISANTGASVQKCSVDGGTITSSAELIGAEYDNGDKAGGIVGYITAADYISECSVSNLTIKAYRDLGGIAGCTSGAVDVKNCTVGENVNITVDNTHNYKNFTDNASYNAGHIVGRDATSNAVTTSSTGTATITYPY